MSIRLARVRRADVVACMTCPLCKKLIKEATTISLCLHTFCRKCIYEKLSDDECDTCPVCDTNLGGDPVDKLRTDHNLQDIRAKIFPMKRSMADAPEAAPAVSHPAKRKERSLSSLVVSAPRVSAQAGTTGRRTRVSMRKSSTPKSSSPSTEEQPSKDDLMEDQTDGTSSPETINKVVKYKKAHSSKASITQIPKEDAGNSTADGKVGLWKPLNCLVEAANGTKFSKSNSLGPSQVKCEPDASQDAKIEENGHRGEAQQAKQKRLRLPKRITAAAPGDSSNSSQLVVDGMRHNRQNMPIWFSLVASEHQEGAVPLPQISSAFLRIKNGNMPVSSIQKYVATKLQLASADEVQIMCQGQTVHPSLQLRGLLESWLRNISASRRVRTRVGSSGKDFVMVLTYSRKVPTIEASVQQTQFKATIQQLPDEASVQQPPDEATAQQAPAEASIQQPPDEAAVEQALVEASIQKPSEIQQKVEENSTVLP